MAAAPPPGTRPPLSGLERNGAADNSDYGHAILCAGRILAALRLLLRLFLLVIETFFIGRSTPNLACNGRPPIPHALGRSAGDLAAVCSRLVPAPFVSIGRAPAGCAR